MQGLVDCNNFFVSCERTVQPQLVGKAVIVLSNNDGCAIARSNEAKALGIKMGEPYFRLRHLVDAGVLHACSAHYALYEDLSRRVMQTVQQLVPHIEVYSIDECFLDLSGLSELEALGRRIAATVLAQTGIPVSVGVAPTKTLAKMGSKFAKKYTGYQGCCLIDTEEKRLKALRLTPIDDVWGIGRRCADKLRRCGIRTAYDLTRLSEEQVRGMLALPGLRTLRELNGTPAIPTRPPSPKKSLAVSRSFRKGITDFPTLRTRVADFAAACAEKLRAEHSFAPAVTTYIRTDPFRTDLPQYANSATVTLDVATDDLRELVAAATQALAAVYRPGYAYKKAGVYLDHLQHGAVCGYLFDTVDRARGRRLLDAIDHIKQRHGASALRVAAQSDSHESLRHTFLRPAILPDEAKC